jgi:hypothetical protein
MIEATSVNPREAAAPPKDQRVPRNRRELRGDRLRRTFKDVSWSQAGISFDL